VALRVPLREVRRDFTTEAQRAQSRKTEKAEEEVEERRRVQLPEFLSSLSFCSVLSVPLW
jgi:hypothetical protein